MPRLGDMVMTKKESCKIIKMGYRAVYPLDAGKTNTIAAFVEPVQDSR